MATKGKQDITKEGKEELEAELRQLIDVERPENIVALQEARALGDLSENSEYDAARDKQREIETRIKEIQNTLKNVNVIRKSNSKSVTLGKKVTVEYVNQGITDTFEMVGAANADPLKKRISNDSPLGSAIEKHLVGDEVTFIGGRGKEFTVKIIEVK